MRSFNDIPSGAGADDDEPLRRLAYAARATSSFPGAFEPASVFSWPGRGRERSADDDLPDSMATVFSEVAPTANRAFDVMDGGVFDNIPIGRAVQAIADAPADIPTDRILIYLDPSPPQTEPTPSTHPARRGGDRVMRAHFVKSTFTALRYKLTTETSWDDLRDLGSLATATQDLKARRRRFLESLPDSLYRAPAATLEQQYRTFRAEVDAHRVVDLLTTPGTGFLRALVPSPAVSSALGLPQADEVRARLLGALLARTEHVCHADATALVAASELLIFWVQTLQNLPAVSSTAPDLAGAKAALYRVRTAGLFVEQRRDVAAVGLALGTESQPPPAEIDDAAMARLLWTDGRGGSVNPFESPDDEEFWRRLDQCRTADTGDQLVGQGWAHLCLTVDALGGSDNPIAPKLFPANARVTPIESSHLQRLTMAAALAVGGLRATSSPQFFTLSSDEPGLFGDDAMPKVATYGRALELDRRAAQPGASSTGRPRPSVGSRSKLAGNQMGNFAAFLDEGWRTHDWRWGRVDASAGLLRALQEMRRTPEVVRPDSEVADQLRTAFEADRLELDRRKHLWSDLPAGHRFQLAARAGIGLQRALWPLTPRRISTRTGGQLSLVPAAVLLMALRPLLVLLPLVTRPAVMAGVVVTVAGAHHVARTDEGAESSNRFLLVALAIAVLLLASQLATLRGRWRVWRALKRSSPDPDDFCTAVLGRVRLAILGALVLLVVVVVSAIAAIVDREPWTWLADALLWLSGVDLVVALVAIAALNLRASRLLATSVAVSRSRPGRLPADWRGLVVSALFVPAAAAVVALVWAIEGRGAAGRVATAVAALAVVGAVHHAWVEGWWSAAMALLAGVVATLVQGGVWAVPMVSDIRWFEHGVGAIVLDVTLLPVVVGVVFALVMTMRRPGLPAFVVLPLVIIVAVYGAHQIAHTWSWLGAVPLGLLLGAAAAAATTLIAPARRSDGSATEQLGGGV